MARGRRPKPDALKALAGNPGKRRRKPDPAPLAEGNPEPVGIASLPVPPAPDYLSPEAADEWRRLAHDLVKLGLLRRLDQSAFEARCELYATWRRCAAVIQRSGVSYTHKGLERQRPEVRLGQDCLRQMRQYDSEFGLTPAARARVNHVTGDQAGQGQLPLGDRPRPDPPRQVPGAAAIAAVPAGEWTDDDYFSGPAH